MWVCCSRTENSGNLDIMDSVTQFHFIFSGELGLYYILSFTLVNVLTNEEPTNTEMMNSLISVIYRSIQALK